MNANSTDTLAALFLTPDARDSYLLCCIIGIIPCLLWLIFYFLQDRHQEPKKEIFSVFVLGAAMTAPAVCLEIVLIKFIAGFGLPPTLMYLISYIVAVGLVEEFFKYAAVWMKEQVINQNYQLDEPVDFVIYMVVSALGFAMVENLLFLLEPSSLPMIFRSMGRAVTAIFVHTLCSGIMGYYMAMTFCHRERKLRLLATGFIVISCLHGLYDFFIMESESNMSFLMAAVSIIIFMACMLYIQFQRLLRMKSVCDMKIGKKSR